MLLADLSGHLFRFRGLGLSRQRRASLARVLAPAPAEPAERPRAETLRQALRKGGERTLTTVAMTTGAALAAIQCRLPEVLQGATRRQQMREIGGEQISTPISRQEKVLLSLIAAATVNGMAAVAGALFFPPLLLATAPLLGLIAVYVYRDAYRTLRSERRVKTELIDALLITALFLGQFWLAGAIGAWVVIMVRYLMYKTRNHSQQRLASLFGEQPRSAWVLVDGAEIELPIEQLRAGDTVVVGAGQMIPVDGTIVAGAAAIDQHMLTGEAQPVEKMAGDPVLMSTMVLAGSLRIRAAQTGEETVASQIQNILNHTASAKTSVESQAERLSDRMAPATLTLGGVALLTGGLYQATAMLVNTPAWKMRLYGPMSVLNFVNLAAHAGILIKDGQALEHLEEVDTILFDKTGTLTLQQPVVHRILPCAEVLEDQLLCYAAAAERRQSHPIARAILAAATARNLQVPLIDDAHYELGYGIKVRIGTRSLVVGSRRFMQSEAIPTPALLMCDEEQSHQAGHSFVFIALDGRMIGAIELRPNLRSGAPDIIRDLRARGIATVIISGDHEAPTRQLAAMLGVDDYRAEVLPEEKADLVSQFQAEGRSICFIGDGINDAIAMRRADVSISLKGATTIATDTAQIVLMDEDLGQISYLLDLTQRFEKNLWISYAISTVPALICAGGVLFLGWGLWTAMLTNTGVSLAGISNVMAPLIFPPRQLKR